MPESWTEDDSWTLLSRSGGWNIGYSYLKSKYCSFVFPSSLLTSNNDSDDGVMVSGRRLTRHCQPVLPPCCPWCYPLVWGCSLCWCPGQPSWWPSGTGLTGLSLCTLMTWLSLPGSALPHTHCHSGPGKCWECWVSKQSGHSRGSVWGYRLQSITSSILWYAWSWRDRDNQFHN